MTIEELIKMLSKFNPDAKVRIHDYNSCCDDWFGNEYITAHIEFEDEPEFRDDMLVTLEADWSN